MANSPYLRCWAGGRAPGSNYTVNTEIPCWSLPDPSGFVVPLSEAGYDLGGTVVEKKKDGLRRFAAANRLRGRANFLDL